MSTRLLLVRHGGTVWSAEDRYAGSTNVELSDEGRRQAKALADRLAGDAVAAAYCSTMNRAVETASIICAPHKLAPVQLPELREIDHGTWEGLRVKEVQEKHADEYAAWSADPYLVAAPRGESGLGVLSRSLPAVRKIVADHPGETVLVVSHKATLRLILCYYLTIDPRLYRERLGQDPCCLNVLEFDLPTEAKLTLMNDTWHYAKQGATRPARAAE